MVDGLQVSEDGRVLLNVFSSQLIIIEPLFISLMLTDN